MLCADKTGTLTEGVVQVRSADDVAGSPSDRVLRLVFLNSAFETGFASPIDEAVRALRPFDLAGYTKRDEVPVRLRPETPLDPGRDRRTDG